MADERARGLPTGLRLHAEPRISNYDDVLSAEECAHIIALARPRLKRSQVSGDDRSRRSEGRTSSRAWVQHDTDEVTRDVSSRLATLVGLPLQNAEPMQVIHYAVGQRYGVHFDAYDLSTARGRKYTARGGQRIVTALVYLSSVEEGGETGFPRLGFMVRPRRGSVLVFDNCHAGTTERHPDAEHEARPVIAGTKWAFNFWFHERSVAAESPA